VLGEAITSREHVVHDAPAASRDVSHRAEDADRHRTEAVEDVRSQGRVALVGKARGDATDVGVEPEDLVQDEDAGTLFANRVRESEVGANPSPPADLDRNVLRTRDAELLLTR
jgi:hypothetical protein